jgi:hypothetical protein
MSMRLPSDVHMCIIKNLRMIARGNPNLRDPEVERLVLHVCKKVYHFAVLEMQQPLSVLLDPPPDEKEDDHGPH